MTVEERDGGMKFTDVNQRRVLLRLSQHIPHHKGHLRGISAQPDRYRVPRADVDTALAWLMDNALARKAKYGNAFFRTVSVGDARKIALDPSTYAYRISGTSVARGPHLLQMDEGRTLYSNVGVDQRTEFTKAEADTKIQAVLTAGALDYYYMVQSSINGAPCSQQGRSPATGMELQHWSGQDWDVLRSWESKGNRLVEVDPKTGARVISPSPELT